MKLFLFIALLCIAPVRSQIIIAAASSMQNALNQALPVFEKATGNTATVVYGSSGKLLAQIKSNAPYDVFLSADMALPESLAVAKLTDGKPVVYARGTLVLWTLKTIDLSNGKKALLDSNCYKIAVADPRTAPYGKAAIAFLQSEKIFALIEKKLVYGDNVSQAAQYILTGSADLGIMAKSLVVTPETLNKGHWVEIPASSYPAIDHGMVRLLQGMKKNPEASKSFYDFILSDKGQEILVNCGFTSIK